MYLVYNTLDKDQFTISPTEIKQFLSDRPLIVFHHILCASLCSKVIGVIYEASKENGSTEGDMQYEVWHEHMGMPRHVREPYG